MKSKFHVSLSIFALLLIVSLQGVGMYYAHRNLMQATKQTLDKCFEKAFIEVVDHQLNRMPLPAGTVTHLIYAPARMRLSADAFYFHGYQQTSALLQKIYRLPEISLDSLSIALSDRLQKREIEADVVIRKFDVNTGETLALTATAIPTGFRALTSKQAFLYKEKGIAVEAILDIPSLWKLREVLSLFVGTLLLLVCIAFTFSIQLRSVFRQGQSITEQRQNFYLLAEQMRQPVKEMLTSIKRQLWGEVEVRSNLLLGDTEQTLMKAKKEEQGYRRAISFSIISWSSLVGTFLLLFIWAGYLYQQKWKEVKYEVDTCFEYAFYTEASMRLDVFLYANKMKGTRREYLTGFTRYAELQMKALGDFVWNNKVHLNTAPLIVFPGQMNVEEGFHLWNAYGLQDMMNDGKIPVPFQIQRMDSLFTVRLKEKEIPSGSIRMFRYPSRELMLYTGDPFPGKLNMRTRMLYLKKDSTVCIEGVVHSTPKYIFSSIWYMLFPLGIIFLFVCYYVFFQIHLFRMQRRLKQFQKDFTYAMVHDMKSPLNSILMGAHSLGSGKLADKPEKEQKYKQVMTEECEHLLALSGRVLLLTQLDKGHLQLNVEEVPLCPLIDDLTAKILLKASKKVEFNTLYHRCETVYADAFCLREVLGNLLDNAIKYSREEVKIDIICESEKGFSKIKICDNGLGIPMKDLSRIFNRFERSVAAARSSKGGATGFGLGLNYVQQVMLAHDGRVEVESEEGRFSEFTLYFPVKE